MNSRNPNKLTLPHLSLQSPVVAEGEWWEGGSDSGEEIPEDEYDIGQLNLGAESPALEFAEPAIVAAVGGGNGMQVSFDGDDVSTSSSLFSFNSAAQAGSSLAEAEARTTLGDSSVGSRLAAHAQPTSLAGRRQTIPRRRSWRSTGSALARESNNSANTQRTVSTTAAPKQSRQSAADRDCGICFEYAVSPCRTLCCGKMFCKEHIIDWLHGPSSDGRCPACEKPCSVDKGVLSLASPAILPTASLSGRRKDSVSGNEKTSTRQRERSDTVVPSTSSFSTVATATPTSPTTTEHTRGRSPSRSLATRSMSAASSASSSTSSSSNSTNSTTVPSEAESPITSEDDESTPPRYSKRPPPTLSRMSSNESGTPTPRGRSAVSDVTQPSAVPTIDGSESSIPPEAQIKSSWKADLAPVEAAPEPPLTSGGYTLEGLGRVTSAVGLTLILYVLFSR